MWKEEKNIIKLKRIKQGNVSENKWRKVGCVLDRAQKFQSNKRPDMAEPGTVKPTHCHGQAVPSFLYLFLFF